MKKYALATVLALILSAFTVLSAQAGNDFRSQSPMVGPTQGQFKSVNPQSDGFWRRIHRANAHQRHVINNLAKKDPALARKALKAYLARRSAAIRQHNAGQ